jgi:hypothetical protein
LTPGTLQLELYEEIDEEIDEGSDKATIEGFR